MIQPKGADRKQKTDREKMEKRAPQEKEKYQPSYETTILTEVSSSLGSKVKIWVQVKTSHKQQHLNILNLCVIVFFDRNPKQNTCEKLIFLKSIFWQ